LFNTFLENENTQARAGSVLMALVVFTMAKAQIDDNAAALRAVPKDGVIIVSTAILQPVLY
jgi:hypothetical protein